MQLKATRPGGFDSLVLRHGGDPERLGSRLESGGPRGSAGSTPVSSAIIQEKV